MPKVEGKAFTYRFSHETGGGGESPLEHDEDESNRHKEKNVNFPAFCYLFNPYPFSRHSYFHSKSSEFFRDPNHIIPLPLGKISIVQIKRYLTINQ